MNIIRRINLLSRFWILILEQFFHEIIYIYIYRERELMKKKKRKQAAINSI